MEAINRIKEALEEQNAEKLQTIDEKGNGIEELSRELEEMKQNKINYWKERCEVAEGLMDAVRELSNRASEELNGIYEKVDELSKKSWGLRKEEAERG